MLFETFYFKLYRMRGLLFLSFMIILSINGYGQSGQDGNVSWHIADSTIVFTGTGAMNDYDDNSNKAPWYPHRSLIKKAVIKTGLTTIGKNAFSLCSVLVSIEITDSVTSIGNNSFLGCRALKSIDIPDSTISIGALAFAACSNLTSIDIPSKVAIIGEGTFSGCSGLSAININVNNSVFKDKDGIVFSKDEKELFLYPAGKVMSSYIVPDHVTKLGYGAFLNCENLAKIEMQNGITTIGREAFYNCKNLKVIKLPGSVTTIENKAFQYCSSLDTVEVDWTTPITVSSDMYTASSIANAILSVPDGTKNAYETAGVWNNFSSIVERKTVTNEQISFEDVKVSYQNEILTIDSPYAETLRVYSTTGALTYSIEKNEGRIDCSVNLPDGVCIVTGGTGWSKKVLKK